MSSRGWPEIEIGGLGNVTVSQRPDGSFQARGRTRTASRELKRLSATAATEEGARELLVVKARRAGLLAEELSAKTTLADLLQLWLAEKRRSGKAKDRSIALYERHVGYLVELASAVAIGDLHAGRVELLIDTLWRQRSLAAARKCVSILRDAFGLAVRRQALAQTPMAVLEPLPSIKGPGTALTVEQVQALRSSAGSSASAAGSRRTRRHCDSWAGAHHRAARLRGGRAS